MLNTRLRIGEAVALHGEQIDRVADVITVDRIFCIASNRVLNVTKSCPLRQIGMNDAIKAALEAIFRNSPLFTTPEENPLRSDYVIKTVFPQACKKAGVKHIGCHGLRHTYASHFMMNGGNVYDLQKILGHRDVKTTERYAHLSKDHIKRKSAIVSFTGNLITVDFKKPA